MLLVHLRYAASLLCCSVIWGANLNYKYASEIRDCEGIHIRVTGRVEGTGAHSIEVFLIQGLILGVWVCGGHFNISLNYKLDFSAIKQQLTNRKSDIAQWGNKLMFGKTSTPPLGTKFTDVRENNKFDLLSSQIKCQKFNSTEQNESQNYRRI